MSGNYDELLGKQRSFLIRVSVAILLFDIAGGEIEDKLTLLSGTVNVANVTVMYAFVILMYMYSLIRYRLSSITLEREIRADFLSSFEVDIRYKRFLKDYWYKDALVDWNPDMNNIAHPKDNVRPMFKWNLFFVNFNFALDRNGRAYATKVVRGEEIKNVQDVKIGAFKFNLIAIKVLIKCMLTKIIYSEYIFPYMIAFLVPVVKWWMIIKVLLSDC